MHREFDLLALACAHAPDDPAAWAAFEDYWLEQAHGCDGDPRHREQYLLLVAGVRYAAAHDARPVRSGPAAWSVSDGGDSRTWVDAVAALGRRHALSQVSEAFTSAAASIAASFAPIRTVAAAFGAAMRANGQAMLAAFQHAGVTADATPAAADPDTPGEPHGE